MRRKLTAKGGRWMSFDWGGFTGGIIGTMGAFGAAWYTMWKQKKNEKPMIDQRTREIIVGIRNTCDKYWWAIMREDFEDTSDAILKTNEIISSMKVYLSAAVGTNGLLVLLVLQTIDGIDNLVDNYTRNVKTDESLKSLTQAVLLVLASKIEECEQMEKELLNRYTTQKRRWNGFLFWK